MTKRFTSPRLPSGLTIALLLAAAGPVLAQGAQADGAAADPRPDMQNVQASDGSASASVPKDWHVTKAADMVIMAIGPQGETASLGNTAIVRDPGGPAAAAKLGGVDMAMPYATPLPEKFLRLVKHADPGNQVSIINSTGLKVDPKLGQCARIVGDISTKDGGPAKFESLFCSLPPDIAGIFKNVFRLVTAPVKVAMQERPMLETIMTSYRLPPKMVQRMLAPVVGPPPGAGGKGPAGPGGGPQGPGGPGGGSQAMSDLQAKQAAQINSQTQRDAAAAIRNAEGADSLLRQ